MTDTTTYLIHIESQDGADDSMILAALLAVRAEMQESLSTRAEQTLGAAFNVELRDIRATSSVRVIAVLGTLYSVQTTPALELQLAAFTATVRDEITQRLEAAGALASKIDVAFEPVGSASELATTKAGTWALVSPILAAIATSIGVVGFATFIGGAIQYGRFAGAGLPAEEAVSVVPTRSLIVLGAKTLTGAVIAGLACAALVFIARAREEGEPEPAGLLQAEANGSRAATIASAVGAICIFALSQADLRKVPVVVLFSVAAFLLASAVGAIANRTAGAVWLATAVFISVGVFVGALEVAHAWDNTDVRGAALVRDNRRAVIGFYIAESGGRVYLGQLIFPPGNNPNLVDKTKSRIIAVSAKEVSDLAIGPPKDPLHAKEQAEELADELCKREPIVPVTPSAPAENCWRYRSGGSKLDQQRETEGRELLEGRERLDPGTHSQ